MKKIESDYVGKKFNNLTVIRFLGVKNHSTYALFLCECGKKKEAILAYVKCGKVKSCGCLMHTGDWNRTHGLGSHPLYDVWNKMRKRCCDSNNPAYANYGARGIMVCKEWFDNFLAFYNWANENGWRKGLQIDRINNNGNYESDNCRFVTAKENSRNRRSNVLLTYNGTTRLLKDWADVLNMPQQTISERIKSMSVKEAFERPRKTQQQTLFICKQ